MTAEKILERTIRVEDCMVWQGALNNKGYGSVAGGRKGLTLLAHRAVWTEMVGEIPEGMTIDHLCREKRCLNVEHMEVVTRGENSRRALAHRTECKYGHTVAGENLRIKVRSGRIYRVCVECDRKHKRDHMRRVRTSVLIEPASERVSQ